MIDVGVLSEAYLIMKEYVPAKDRQTAADHLISSLVDMSIDDRELRKFAATDSYLERSIDEYLGKDEDEIDPDDFDDYEDD
jgi:hypothetical protein